MEKRSERASSVSTCSLLGVCWWPSALSSCSSTWRRRDWKNVCSFYLFPAGRLLVDKCPNLLQFNLEARESKWQRKKWSHLFPGRILSYDWILLVANPGEEAAPALLPLLPHLPPGVAAGVVEGKEEAAKEVSEYGEDGRNSTLTESPCRATSFAKSKT